MEKHMWGRLVFSTLLIATVPQIALAQEQYICIEEKSTGFSWNGSEWSISTFAVTKEAFLLQQIPPLKIGDETHTFEVRRFGENYAYYYCRHAKGEGYSRIICGGLMEGMVIDTMSLRYHELYAFGYTHGIDNSSNTPSLKLGKCARAK
jgi:hypothetical protein